MDRRSSINEKTKSIGRELEEQKIREVTDIFLAVEQRFGQFYDKN